VFKRRLQQPLLHSRMLGNNAGRATGRSRGLGRGQNSRRVIGKEDTSFAERSSRCTTAQEDKRCAERNSRRVIAQSVGLATVAESGLGRGRNSRRVIGKEDTAGRGRNSCREIGQEGTSGEERNARRVAGQSDGHATSAERRFGRGRNSRRVIGREDTSGQGRNARRVAGQEETSGGERNSCHVSDQSPGKATSAESTPAQRFERERNSYSVTGQEAQEASQGQGLSSATPDNVLLDRAREVVIAARHASATAAVLSQNVAKAMHAQGENRGRMEISVNRWTRRDGPSTRQSERCWETRVAASAVQERCNDMGSRSSICAFVKERGERRQESKRAAKAQRESDYADFVSQRMDAGREEKLQEAFRNHEMQFCQHRLASLTGVRSWKHPLTK